MINEFKTETIDDWYNLAVLLPMDTEIEKYDNM